MIITIDGPVASGKSTVAKMLAKHLHFYYINSGFLYRSFAYILHYKCGIDLNALESYDFKEELPFSLEKYFYDYSDYRVKILFDGEDITRYLIYPNIDAAASIIAKNPYIRDHIVNFQRHLASLHRNVIAEGRDCGTFVFDKAKFKFFLTASLEARAQRWAKSKQRTGNYFTLEEAMHFIQQRDERDMQRPIAPLKQAPDAIVIDNTSIGLNETVQLILDKMKQA
jgi:cytidylate kinase